MEKYFVDNLLDGEEILWEGTSEPFKILSGPYKKRIPFTWALSGIVLVAFAVAYIPMAIRLQSSPIEILFACTLVLLVPICLSLYSYTDPGTIQHGVKYVLTNYRAVVIGKHEIHHMRIDENTPYRVEYFPDGTEILYIGDGCNTKAAASRKNAIMGVREDNTNYSKITGLVFYGIKDAKRICRKYAVFARKDAAA